MDDTPCMFAQRSLFKVSKLGFPIDFYETNIWLVIINILFPNAIPGINNSSKVFSDIISVDVSRLLYGSITRLREITYICDANLFNKKFKSIDEFTSLSPLLNSFISDTIKNDSYIPKYLFMMNSETFKITSDVFEVIIPSSYSSDISKKNVLQMCENGIIRNIMIDGQIYAPGIDRDEYEWAKYNIMKLLFSYSNAKYHTVCGHLPFHNMGFIYKQTIPDTHPLGIFFNYLMGSSYGLVCQTQTVASGKENSTTKTQSNDLFDDLYMKGNNFEYHLQNTNPFVHVQTMLNENIQLNEIKGLSELLKTIKEHLFELVYSINHNKPLGSDTFVIQFWRLLRSYYKDIPVTLNVETLSDVLYSCVLFTICHSIFHSDLSPLLITISSPIENVISKNIIDCIPNKIDTLLSLVIGYYQSIIAPIKSDTLFQIKNVYTNNTKLNDIMNELSDEVTSIINKYNLQYIKHGLLA